MTKRARGPRNDDERATALVGVVRAVESEVAAGFRRPKANEVLAIGPVWAAVDAAKAKKAEAERIAAEIRGE